MGQKPRSTSHNSKQSVLNTLRVKKVKMNKNKMGKQKPKEGGGLLSDQYLSEGPANRMHFRINNASSLTRFIKGGRTLLCATGNCDVTESTETPCRASLTSTHPAATMATDNDVSSSVCLVPPWCRAGAINCEERTQMSPC